MLLLRGLHAYLFLNKKHYIEFLWKIIWIRFSIAKLNQLGRTIKAKKIWNEERAEFNSGILTKYKAINNDLIDLVGSPV